MPELQRAGGRDGHQVAGGQLLLDRPAVLRQVARAVGADLRPRLGIVHAAPGEVGQQLRGAPRPCEADRAGAVVDQAGHDRRGLGQRASPRARLVVDDRRVPQREELAAARRVVGLDHLDVEARSAGRPARRGCRPWRSRGTSAGRRRAARSAAAAAAAPSPPASRRPRAARAPRRSRRSTAGTGSRPIARDRRAATGAACRGSSARGWRSCGSAAARPSACRRRRRPRAPAGASARASRAAGRAPAPWSGTGTARWPSAS